MHVIAIVVPVFLAAFLFGLWLGRWSHGPERPAQTVPLPELRGVVARWSPSVAQVVDQAFLEGVRVASRIPMVPPRQAMAALEGGQVVRAACTSLGARLCGHAHAEGIGKLRSALGRWTAIEPHDLDRAMVDALRAGETEAETIGNKKVDTARV